MRRLALLFLALVGVLLLCLEDPAPDRARPPVGDRSREAPAPDLVAETVDPRRPRNVIIGVRREGGAPVAEANVTFADGEWSWTDARGEARVRFAGALWVSVSTPEGFEALGPHVTAPGRYEVVVPEPAVVTVDLVDEEGRPLEGKIEPREFSPGEPTELPAGPITLTFGAALHNAPPLLVALRPGERRTIRVEMKRGVDVAGVAPARSQILLIDDRSGWNYENWTGDDGRFRFEGLPACSGRWRVRIDGGATWEGFYARPTELSGRFRFGGAGALTGSWTPAPAHATYRLDFADRTSVEGSLALADGRFSIPNPGIVLPCQLTLRSPTRLPLVVGEVAFPSDIGDLHADAGRTFELEVLDPDGRPASGARVYCEPDGFNGARGTVRHVGEELSLFVVWGGQPWQPFRLATDRPARVRLRRAVLVSGTAASNAELAFTQGEWPGTWSATADGYGRFRRLLLPGRYRVAGRDVEVFEGMGALELVP